MIKVAIMLQEVLDFDQTWVFGTGLYIGNWDESPLGHNLAITIAA